MSLLHRSAVEMRERLRSGSVTAVEVLEELLAHIENTDTVIRAYVNLFPEQARAQAARVDERIQKGEPVGRLAGIPVAVKDNICTRDQPTTCASKMLANFVPPYEATAVEKLRKEGAVILGKTNLDEFAMGSSCENSAFFPTRHPTSPQRIPGGSSGGSAAAMASGQAYLSLGSDTGGSIRQPAAFCGVVGLKPTYGRVSRWGLVAYASSLDQLGPVTRTVRDAALLLEVIAGYDERDTASAAGEVPDYQAATQADLQGVRLGLPREYFGEGLDPETAEAVRNAARELEKAGATLRELSLPHTPYGIAAYYLIAPAEASSNLGRYDGVHYGVRAAEAENLEAMVRRSREEAFGPEVKRRILLGTFALSTGYYEAYYLKALKVRRLIKRDFDEAFREVDALVCPTSPVPAFKRGEKLGDPLQMYLCDVLTVGANLAGLPGLSVPCGRTREGLPIGMQLLGRPFDEETVLRVAAGWERIYT